jgi:hypothetical protein
MSGETTNTEGPAAHSNDVLSHTHPSAATSDAATTNSAKIALNKLRFTKMNEAAGRGESPQGQTNEENIHLGKRPRVDTESHSADEVEQHITPMRSLSDFAPSPASTPPPSDVVMPPTTRSGPTEEDTKAAAEFLARLQAKDKATKQTPTSQPSPSAITTSKFTPKPENGFPVAHGRNATHAFDNIDLSQLTDWLKVPGPCVFVQPLFHGYYPPALAQEIVGILKSTIEDLFACEGIKVTAPIAVSPPNNVDHAPYTYLVRNLPANAASELISQRCWATEKIGFLVYTAEAIMPTHLGAIDGLGAAEDDDVAMIRDLVVQTFYSSDIGILIAEISASHPELRNLTPVERAANILLTLDIRIIKFSAQGGIPRPIANMYINCPFEKDEDWTRLVDAVAKVEFRHSFLGTGTVRQGWSCTICHGSDHPSGLCPFPSTPGWINAKPIIPIMDYRNRLNLSRRDAGSNINQTGGC